MLPADIASVLRVQAHCYLPDNIESEAVIRARLASAPDTAEGTDDTAGDAE